jgi:NADH:ubiquinone oxidoreductase subunit F (NADH-binding)
VTTGTTLVGPAEVREDEPLARHRRLLLGVVPGRALSLAEHTAVHGALPRVRGRLLGPHRHPLVAELKRAGIGGRGGAGFPFGRKLESVARASRRPVVVVNVAESEPAARKDAVLSTLAPHLVLDGAQVAARLVGARDVIVWTHGRDGVVSAAYRTALRERRRGRGMFRVVEGPDRYVAGESSAVVRFLSGGPAKPTTSPPRVSERGVDGRPTLLSNAETFAHVALVIRHGADWFRSVGTEDEPGTLLVTLGGAVERPGVVEVPFGTPVADLVAAAGGVTEPVAAVLAGGYGGGWLHYDTVARLTLGRAAFAEAGGELGVGLLTFLPSRRCGVAETDRLVSWMAGESAGQCGPCVNGLPAMARAWHQLSTAGDPAAPGLLLRWSEMVTGRGACHHPDGVAALVRSALSVFHDDIDRHSQRRGCPGCAEAPVLPVPEPPPARRRRRR